MSSESVCPEFDELAQGSHDRFWVTVAGTTSIEFEDGAQDLLTLWAHRAEHLPPLS